MVPIDVAIVKSRSYGKEMQIVILYLMLCNVLEKTTNIPRSLQ